MDFTREPIIESVITPKEGCKLVVRSSKGAGQEEFFVDALEVVSFGNTFFLRSLERPKSFLVPASDYEILEVRETRMVLKNVGFDRSIKIGGGREGGKKTPKEAEAPAAPEGKAEPKRRERRRQYRRRRTGREESVPKETGEVAEPPEHQGKVDLPEPEKKTEEMEQAKIPPTSVLRSLLSPPPTLISDSIERYKDDEIFKDVFYPRGGLETEMPVEEPSQEEGQAEPAEKPEEPIETEQNSTEEPS